jgi:ribonuclease M5
MKKTINGIIVVEGTTDVSFLSQFLDAEFIITNGSAISQETIDYLAKSSGNRDIFVLTDPDSPGKKIRDILDSNIPNLKHCFVSKEKSIKNGKVGVAESTKEEVLEALEKYVQTKQLNVGIITHSDLVNLGLEGSDDSSSKRKIVIDKLHLGQCNAKTFLKRLNYSGITIEELKNIL